MAYLEMMGVSKGYGWGESRTEVLTDINLSVDEGEIVAIVGFSGSGKTTLMSLLAGLIKPDSGKIFVEGKEVNGTSSERGLVFQNYSLLPWLTVAENVELAVNQVYGNESSDSRKARVLKVIDRVNLSAALGKKPGELSGGMRQRNSVARTLSMNPKVLLLDEPLSALDELTRRTVQDEILDIWNETRQTIVLITNDVDEGLYLADRIIPLSVGPGATLGPEVRVKAERPRSRTALSRDEEFRVMREEVLDYLLAQKRKEAGNADLGQKVQLPDIRPIDLNKEKKEPQKNRMFRANATR